MVSRVTRYLSAALCAVGLIVATGAQADDRGHRGRHHRDSHHHRYDDRGHRDDRGHDRRHGSREHDRGYRSEWRGRDVHWDDRPRGYRVHSYPYWRHRCNDRRHYGYAHFHVPVRHYQRDYYERYPYRGVYRDRGAEATVVLSFPL